MDHALLTRSFVAHRPLSTVVASIDRSFDRIFSSAYLRPFLYFGALLPLPNDASTVGTKKIPRQRATAAVSTRPVSRGSPLRPSSRLPADKEGNVFVILTSMTKTRRTRTCQRPLNTLAESAKEVTQAEVRRPCRVCVCVWVGGWATQWDIVL